ncbi:radical SAM protein [Oscillibacter ruminantium]|uniref:radical SAM protein n=1 Tax=Oscillibacter ruminantium TaxID=1263547 RepID=UPI00030D2C45|nr:radical SAM protein [Oscillibacter ruminantium]
MKPIYEPKGKAKEYGDLAINIYTGCPHRCFYCFGPSVLHRDRECFHCNAEPRTGIVEAVKEQLRNKQITGKLIHLCFTCDPYPEGYDTSATRKIIEALKNSGNHVQILTKNDGSRDFDLLDKDDWYGVTFTGAPHEQEPGTIIGWSRIRILVMAKRLGISTWVSCEPVIDDGEVLKLLQFAEYVDKFKIGKLNYHPSDIDWGEFGHAAEAICKERGLNYYIKESLRAEMESMK